MKKYYSNQLMESEMSIHLFAGNGEDRELHCHDFIEIVYIMSGSAKEYVNSEVYTVSGGDLIFINYGSTHRFESSPDFSFVNICFAPETMGRSIITAENAFAVLQLTAFDELRRDSDSGLISFRGAERAETESLLQSMLREYSERRASWKAALESYMNLLMIRILRKSLYGMGGESATDVWGQLSAYIDENLGADLTLSALARKCFYNPSYFSRVFKEKFNMTLTEYINRRKTECAKSLASDRRLTVEKISEMSGFSSKTSFYRVFSQVSGMTFSEYRRSIVK